MNSRASAADLETHIVSAEPEPWQHSRTGAVCCPPRSLSPSALENVVVGKPCSPPNRPLLGPTCDVEPEQQHSALRNQVPAQKQPHSRCKELEKVVQVACV
eukprot:3705101-Rhodomonas_salina.1